MQNCREFCVSVSVQQKNTQKIRPVYLHQTSISKDSARESLKIMLLIIHNLPSRMRFADVKSFIVSKCGFNEVILDNFVTDGYNTKKVTVGLAEEEDAALLVRQINGLFLEGRQLYVEDVRQKKSSDQPFRQTHNSYESPNTNTQRSNNQQSNYPSQNYQQGQFPNQIPGYQPGNYCIQPPANPKQVMPIMMPLVGGMNMGGIYYMPQGQNSYMDYTGQSQQLSSSATQYPQISGQQGQSGSGSDYQTPKADKWTPERRDRFGDNDNSHGTQSTYKSDTRQQSGWWAAGSDVDTLRRRSISPRNKRERSRGGSSLSPKRARNEDNNRDVYRNSSNFNRDSQRYSSDRDETYGAQTYGISHQNKPYTSTSQTYGNSNQNKPYYNNDPVTATSSNSQLQPLMSRPAQNQGNAGTYNPAFQQKKCGRFSDSDTYEDNPQVASWDSKVTNPLDSRSNYRKHLQQTNNMQKKSAPDQSKNIWRNPAQTSWDIQDTTSYGDKVQSQFSWKNPGLGDNDPKVASWGVETRASDKDKLQVGKNPQVHQKSSESSPLDKPLPIKNAPKGKSNLQTQWPKKQKKNKGKGKAKSSVMPLIKQDAKCRHKAACRITGEIANAHRNIIKQEYMKHLRQSVRTRLEILLAEKLGESIAQMVAIYRAKFPPFQDREFCKLVVQQIPTELKTVVNLTDSDVKAEAIKQEKPSPQAAKNKNQQAAQKSRPISSKSQPIAGQIQPISGKSQPIAGKSQPIAGKSQPIAGQIQPILGKSQPIAGKSHPTPSRPVLPRLRLPNPMEKLPKYPNANKQVYKEQKKLKKLEYQNEDIYTLPPLLQQALEEELTIISNIFQTVASKPDSVTEKELCDRFLSIGLEQVRKVVKLNVAKRILNINTNLIIRVLVSGKPPKKQEVELFLRREKVVSMKKSGKRNIVYVATCNNFQTYDRLLQMQSARLNRETLLRFLPFQLVGPKLSYKERNELRVRRLMGLEGSKSRDFTNTETNPDNLGNDAESDNELIIDDDQENYQEADQEDGEEVEQDNQHGYYEGAAEDLDFNAQDLEDY